MGTLMPPAPSAPRTLLAGLTQKQQAVADVIAGRLTLHEAAARFQAAGGKYADHETLCRAVIGWVHLALRHHPDRADRVAGRLECELQNTGA